MVHEDFVNLIGDKLAVAESTHGVIGESFSASYQDAILKYLPIVLQAVLELVGKLRSA